MPAVRDHLPARSVRWSLRNDPVLLTGPRQQPASAPGGRAFSTCPASGASARTHSLNKRSKGRRRSGMNWLPNPAARFLPGTGDGCHAGGTRTTACRRHRAGTGSRAHHGTVRRKTLFLVCRCRSLLRRAPACRSSGQSHRNLKPEASHQPSAPPAPLRPRPAALQGVRTAPCTTTTTPTSTPDRRPAAEKGPHHHVNPAWLSDHPSCQSV